MRRLRPLDALLLAVLTGSWCACFALHLDSVQGGRLAWLPVGVDGATGRADFPRVHSIWPGSAAWDGLQIGDRVMRVGEVALPGAGRLDFVTAVYAEARGGRVPVEVQRDGARLQRQLQLPAVVAPWRKSLVAASFALLGALTLWRTRGTREGRAFYLAMTAYAFHWTDFWGGSPARTTAAIASFGAATALALPLALRVPLIFPAEAARDDRFSQLWPWLFLASGPLMMTWAFGLPAPLAHAATLALAMNAFYIALLLVLLLRSYRACGALGRRQTKWVLLGFLIGLGPAFVASLIALAVPELWWLYEACLALAAVTPVCLFIALVRYQLFDVDRLITAAATWTVVGVTAIAGVFLVAPRTAAAAAEWIAPSVSQPLLSLALGGLVFVGLRHADRALHDRIYPERRALREDAQLLRRDLGECEKPTDMLELLGRRLRSLLRLDTVAIYGRGEDAFAPVFARGHAVAPGFDPDGALVSYLEQRPAPVETDAIASAAAPEPDHSALRSMGVELTLPLVIRGELEAFVCLGGKRSEDAFTGTDRALLQGIADRAADVLEGFDRVVLERESRALMQELRSFVPGAVAREIESGAGLESGEQEVSVLFVDIRGYTPFAEGRRAADIFEAVSHYATLVSRLVEEHGGSVVEFHGDGLMAVFGAPRPLERKEARAVEAGLAIAEQVPHLEIDPRDTRARLEVGVGIATGEAYVGPLRAVDRAIWVALGNTTNLAARLEGATRTLGVSVVIDAATFAAAGPAAAGFARHPQLAVKGRRERMDVHIWSTPAKAGGGEGALA
jgi:class 3 adenylate cyclase